MIRALHEDRITHTHTDVILNAPNTPGLCALSLHDALPIFGQQLAGALVVLDRDDRGLHDRQTAVGGPAVALLDGGRDRKSTRLNSSHVASSYAVFCLKKKKAE